MTEKILKNEFPIILSYLINNKLKQYEPKCNIQKNTGVKIKSMLVGRVPGLESLDQWGS